MTDGESEDERLGNTIFAGCAIIFVAAALAIAFLAALIATAWKVWHG